MNQSTVVEVMTRKARELGFVAGLVLLFAVHLPSATLAQDGLGLRAERILIKWTHLIGGVAQHRKVGVVDPCFSAPVRELDAGL